ncbi:hypothetical protein JJB07_03350 [Tumebacillus sp. ITR2]|uniref:Uncharacterized protein n=1 Tax=Tumebacillus amylolyticus TaxID=2801339 RepID=A0ABS1J5X0_9BACL|nr:hypothetical protein [Tumebacillus amylolyticus]MBL0385677.1 hypothetical protein [Tumebacillus amylolyticus]
MKRMWKFLRTILWLAVVAAVVAVGVRTFAYSHEFRQHDAQQQRQQQQQGQSYGREDRHTAQTQAFSHRNETNFRGERGEHHDGFGGVIGFFVGLVLLVGGWKFWKRRVRRRPMRMTVDSYVSEQTFDALDEWEAKTRRELKNQTPKEEQ